MMRIFCTCGKEMTINKMKGKYDTMPVVKQCDECMLLGYDIGFVDGGGTLPGSAKTTLAAILASTSWTRNNV